MIDIQQLIELDKQLLFTLNGGHSLFWDGFMWTVTSTFTWIPVAAALLYVIFKNNRISQAVIILLMIALCITISDQVASGVCKGLFARFRPSQDPELMYMVHTVNGYRGGMYGFMSSHAANTFTVAMLVSLLVRNYLTTIVTFTWAMLASYSRIYLGVHYPGDILCGAILGMVAAVLVYAVYRYVNRKNEIHIPRYSQGDYTSGGYTYSTLSVFYCVLMGTYFVAVIVGMLQIKYLFL